MKTKIKIDMVLTSSKILAFLITILGTFVSIYLKDGSIMVATVVAAGVIIAIKTGSKAYNDRNKKE